MERGRDLVPRPARARARPRRARRAPSSRRSASRHGSAGVSPASSSSSIAACPSYEIRVRTPSTAATASKRRPIPEASGAFTARRSPHALPLRPRDEQAGALEMDGGDPPRLAHRRLAAGKRNGLEPREPLEAVEVAAQQLAAPERPVGPVAGAVEDERERRPRLAVLGEARRRVRVVMLHLDERQALARAPTSSRGTRGGDRTRSLRARREASRGRGAGRRGTRGTPARSRGRRDAPRGTPRRRGRRRTCSSARRRPRRAGRARGSGAAAAGARSRASGAGRPRGGRRSPRSGGGSAGRGRGTRRRPRRAVAGPRRRRTRSARR